jgi:hypothetical protein
MLLGGMLKINSAEVRCGRMRKRFAAPSTLTVPLQTKDSVCAATHGSSLQSHASTQEHNDTVF